MQLSSDLTRSNSRLWKDRFWYYNRRMLTGFPLNDEWNSDSSVRALFGATRWNQYHGNWPVVLGALRMLWEKGKVSEMKSPFSSQSRDPSIKQPHSQE
jgi:hypothetical protein